MGSIAPHELVAAARRADADASRHKRAANTHRRAAQAARLRQAEIEAQCARLGITITYDPGEGHPPWPENPSSTSQP